MFGLFFRLNFETIELYNMEIMKLLFEWLMTGKLSIIFDFFKEKNYKLFEVDNAALPLMLMSQFMKIFKQNSKKLPPIKSVSIQIVKI